jgi:hypothetical protein
MLGFVGSFLCGFLLAAALAPEPPAPAAPLAGPDRPPAPAVIRPGGPPAPASGWTGPPDRAAPRPEDLRGAPAYPGLPYALPREGPTGAPGTGETDPWRATPPPSAGAPGYPAPRPWGETRPREDEMRPLGEKGGYAPEYRRREAPPAPYAYPDGAAPWGVSPYYPAPGAYPYGGLY